MFIKKALEILSITSLVAAGVLLFNSTAFAMGGKPEKLQLSTPTLNQDITKAPTSNVTLKELAQIYWPDSNSTEAQQEATLKNLLGKRVNWEITVAQIQRNGDGYLVQGQSDKDMLGTFSYVTPRNEAEREQILKASVGSSLNITGIVNDIEMRHIVLKPAFIN